jgi:hypothetical protein
MEVFAMSRTRWFLLALTCLIGITPLIASPGSVGAAPGPKPNKPIVLSIDDLFLAPNLTDNCGFDVWAHFVGTIKTSWRRSGIQVDQYHIERTYTGPSGNSLRQMDTGPSTISEWVSEDGQTIVLSITNSGQIPHHMVVPGYGSIANNSGHEVLQITLQWDATVGGYVEVDFQVLLDAGQSDDLTADEWTAVCNYLA